MAKRRVKKVRRPVDGPPRKSNQRKPAGSGRAVDDEINRLYDELQGKGGQRTRKNGKKRRFTSTKWPIVGIILGLLMLAYPIVTDAITNMLYHQTISEAVGEYSPDKNDPERVTLLEQAKWFNQRLAKELPASVDPGKIKPYKEQLSYKGADLMAWVEIPQISVELPVYHGTDANSLMSGIGHLENTSLPIGGVSSNSVLTAHSGMSRTRMFDDISKLEKGEVFTIHTLGDELYYKVTGSDVVLPSEVEKVSVQQGKDMVTLVTCTPIGINSHRLLVYAERTDEKPGDADMAKKVANYLTGRRALAFLIALLVLIVALVGLWLMRRRRKKLLERLRALQAANEAKAVNSQVPRMAEPPRKPQPPQISESTGRILTGILEDLQSEKAQKPASTRAPIDEETYHSLLGDGGATPAKALPSRGTRSRAGWIGGQYDDRPAEEMPRLPVEPERMTMDDIMLSLLGKEVEKANAAERVEEQAGAVEGAAAVGAAASFGTEHPSGASRSPEAGETTTGGQQGTFQPAATISDGTGQIPYPAPVQVYEQAAQAAMAQGYGQMGMAPPVVIVMMPTMPYPQGQQGYWVMPQQPQQTTPPPQQ